MKKLRLLVALTFFPLLATAGEVEVDLDFVTSTNVTNPGILQFPQVDFDGLAFISDGLAKGSPGRANISTVLEMDSAIIFPAPPGCEGANVAFAVWRQEVTLVFNDLSAVYARHPEGTNVYYCFAGPGNSWFSSAMSVMGGSGKYLGATGELEIGPGPEADTDVSTPGLGIGSGSVKGYIVTP